MNVVNEDIWPKSVPVNSPFDLGNEDRYQDWKTWKLHDYPSEASQLLVRIQNPYRLSGQEIANLTAKCRKGNSVIYKITNSDGQDKELVRALGQQLGLTRLDGNLCADEDSITSLQVMPGGTRHEGYIPYSNRSINWHTDGYYNTPDKQIQAMVLHCASDAAEGGENEILDPEIVYILMREENHDLVKAFMQKDAMTIPANIENGVEIRGAQSGPVFSIDPVTGTLHMRYTARKRNIIWKDDEATKAAVLFIEELLRGGGDYIFNFRLSPGEGIISNNALHNRTAFSDDPDGKKRLVYRARYYDRIKGTNLNDILLGRKQ